MRGADAPSPRKSCLIWRKISLSWQVTIFISQHNINGDIKQGHCNFVNVVLSAGVDPALLGLARRRTKQMSPHGLQLPSLNLRRSRSCDYRRPRINDVNTYAEQPPLSVQLLLLT